MEQEICSTLNTLFPPNRALIRIEKDNRKLYLNGYYTNIEWCDPRVMDPNTPENEARDILIKMIVRLLTPNMTTEKGT